MPQDFGGLFIASVRGLAGVSPDRDGLEQENRGALPPAPDIRLSRRNWNREFGAWNLGVREVRSRFAERSRSVRGNGRFSWERLIRSIKKPEGTVSFDRREFDSDE